MKNLQAALKRKIGPLPAWAWAGIAAVALFLYRRHQQAADAGGAQQQTPTYYGPYGQDAFPIQGGAGTGPGDSSGNSGGGGDSGTQPVQQPPTIVVNPPDSTTSNTSGGGGGGTTRPRTTKQKPQHAQKWKGPNQPKHGHHPDAPRHTQTAHGNHNVARPRHPASTHSGPAARPRVTSARASTDRQTARPAPQHAATAPHPAPHTAPHPVPRPAPRPTPRPARGRWR